MTVLAPTEQQKVAETAGQVESVVAEAQAIAVRTPEEAQVATGFLAKIAAAKRSTEKARRFLVDPLNHHVKIINEQFKITAGPLEEADQLVRAKVLAYRREEEQRRAAEQARLDAERRAAEEAAEAERRRAAEDAARAEREAAEAEARRQAEMAAEADEHRQLIRAMGEDSLRALIANGDEPDVKSAMGELASRAEARKAKERAAQARQEAEEAQQREIAAKSAPALDVAAAAPLAAEQGSASVRKEWKARLVDEEALPREYLQPNLRKITAAVKAGVRDIPGVAIEQAEGLAVRTR